MKAPQRQAGISQPALLTIAVALLIAASLIFLFSRRSGDGSTEETRKPYEALGEIAAVETSKLIGGKGRIIVVIFNTDKGILGDQNLILAGFQRGARLHALDIVATEKVDFFGPDILQGKPAITANQYADWVQRDSADAVVSFVGAPMLTPEQAAAVGQRRVKFVSLGQFCQPTSEMMAAHVVDLAILPAVGLVEPGHATGSTR